MLILMSSKDVESVVRAAWAKAHHERERAANEPSNSDHFVDDDRLTKRYVTGWLAEMAICRFLGREMNLAIGRGWEFNLPDLGDCGVKAVCGHDRDWLVPRDPTHPELLCRVIRGRDEDGGGIEVHVLGIATVEMLRKYQNDDGVLDKRALHSKTSFDYPRMLFDGQDLQEWIPST